MEFKATLLVDRKTEAMALQLELGPWTATLAVPEHIRMAGQDDIQQFVIDAVPKMQEGLLEQKRALEKKQLRKAKKCGTGTIAPWQGSAEKTANVLQLASSSPNSTSPDHFQLEELNGKNGQPALSVVPASPSTELPSGLKSSVSLT